MTTVLVVEDEESYVDALTVALTKEGFDVAVARDGAEAIEQFAAVRPDVILLDVMLPKLSGVEVCRQIRRTSSVPIIMVTARDGEIDTVVGLEVGADDYVTKPYRVRELVARVHAVLRRATASGDAPVGDVEVLDINGVRLDRARHDVSVRGEAVHLPLKEFELLEVLMSNAGRVLTRGVLIEEIWGYDYVGDTKTLDVHVKRLRAKVEVDPSRPLLISTVRGLGYRFETQRGITKAEATP